MRKKLTTEEFIEKSRAVHGSKYDYSNTTYKTARIKVDICCLEHGVFYQKPHDHMYGRGCPKCAGVKNKTTKEFIKESKLIFLDEYDYNKTVYLKSDKKLIITCKQHGDFEVTPNNHLSKKQGCPICRESKGEVKIRKLLIDKNILFVREKTFNDCKGKIRCLPFDFYLPNHNLVIEYDGKHHFEIVDAFGGKRGFNDIRKNDKIKNNYLLENNIKLLRIPYYEYDNIELILNKMIS